MASVMKFTDDTVVKLLKHDDRRIKHDRNEDIDSTRTHLNYDLTPVRRGRDGHLLTKIEYYHHRKSEVYCYSRADVKTVAGCIVTLPREITDEREQCRFFESTTRFLFDRYGQENILSVSIHYDEGKKLYLKDSNGEIIRDKHGKGIQEFHLGQPHLHCLFMPVTKIDHASLMQKKNHVKAMEQFSEKISAADVLNKRELQRFHPDLQRHLEKDGISCNVHTGITREQGGNRSVAEYKREFNNPYIQSIIRENGLLKEQVTDLARENEKLKAKVQEIEKSIDKEPHSGWGKSQLWGKEHTWSNHTIDI